MRHNKKTPKLGVLRDHRKALLRNLATSLALNGKVKTTTAKAKVLMSYYGHLITLAKRSEGMNAIRVIKQYIYTEAGQKAFFLKLQALSDVTGHLRMTKLGFRKGDNAEVSMVEFV